MEGQAAQYMLFTANVIVLSPANAADEATMPMAKVARARNLFMEYPARQLVGRFIVAACLRSNAERAPRRSAKGSRRDRPRWPPNPNPPFVVLGFRRRSEKRDRGH